MTIRTARAVTASALILPALVPALVATGAGSAFAGGFGLREQSAYYQGTSFAGNAAGGDGLASMYWNPAALSFQPGLSVEANASYIMPHATIDVYNATSPIVGNDLGNVGVGDIVNDAMLPTAYVNYATDRVAVGLAVTSPYGLVTDAQCNWSGAFYGCESRIFDINVQGNIAFKLADWITLGAGLQVNYIDAKLTQAQVLGVVPARPPVVIAGYSKVDGDDLTLGFNVGALFTLKPGTTLGIGYRSGLDHTLEGGATAFLGPIPVSALGATADLSLPDQITASFRSQIDPKWTVMGSVEWTNWSKVQQLVVVPTSGPASVLDLQWSDGWFFSGGAEYRWDPRLALRAGIAYELTPVDGLRTPRLPDTDRFWLSGGFTYDITPQFAMDFAYTHIFGQSGEINLSQTDSANTLRGNLLGEVTNGYVDIVSVGLRYKFDAPVVAARITK